MKITLDLEDPAEAVRHLRNMSGGMTWGDLADIADQIEAQLPKPKPDEPTGLGTVVEDEGGTPWVLADPDAPDSMRWYSGTQGWSAWDEIEGVQP